MSSPRSGPVSCSPGCYFFRPRNAAMISLTAFAPLTIASRVTCVASPAPATAATIRCINSFTNFSLCINISNAGHPPVKQPTPKTMDYIPPKDSIFATWLANFAALLTAAPATYGLTVGNAAAVQGAADDFAAAYAAATSPSTRTPASIAAKDDARAAVTAIVRPFATSVSGNPAVSNENKAALGVSIRSTQRTPVPPPLTAPALNLVSAVSGQHVVGFSDPTTPTSKAKPPGAAGMQVFAVVGTTPAINPLQAAYVVTVTKSPAVFATDPADRGKTRTYFARWVTRGGPGGQALEGPFSDPLAVIVQ